MPKQQLDTVGRGYVLVPGEGDARRYLGHVFDWKTIGAQTDGAVAVVRIEGWRGGEPPVHFHTREDEFFYVLDGTFEIRIGDELHRVGPGGFAFVPRGTVHNFRNTGQSPARILVGFTPGGIEGFFRESGRPATDDGPAPPVDEDEIARTIAAAPKYGLEAVAFDA